MPDSRHPGAQGRTPPARDIHDSARILVVDDTEANRDLLVRRLQREGHSSAVAENGRVALDLLMHEAFDLVLLDIRMPVMDGYELLDRIKANDTLQHLPVIVISAQDDADSVVKAIVMGADDYLPKPFNPHILRARIGASLARKRLRDREQLYAQSLERELEIARRIQSEFLPRQLPRPAGWELAVWFQPARRVAGDFYDAFELPGGRRTAIVVADVCDKGVGAALFMALLRSLMRVLAARILTPGTDVATGAQNLIDGVNDYIARTHDHANMFATVFLAVLDPDSGEMVYVNGGHEPPVIVGDGGVRARLAPTGPAVGLLPDRHFAARAEVLARGEMLVVFTDGVTDAHDAEGTPFPDQALLEALTAPAISAADMVSRIREGVQGHVQDAQQFDDITLFVAHHQA